MRDDLRIPDLTFPSVELGKFETPWDLKSLLYLGGAGTNVREVAGKIDSEHLDNPLLERLSLVQGLHEAIADALAGGGSKETARNTIGAIRQLFAWADTANHPLTVQAVASTYLHWTDALLHRMQVQKNLKPETVYRYSICVGTILDVVLGRLTPLYHVSRITKPPKRKTVRGVQADKQNLQWTFEFGHLLQDICDGLSIEVVLGPLPVRIPLRSGGELVEWSGLLPSDSLICSKQDTPSRRYQAKASKATRAVYEADRTVETRYPLVNFRMEAELLMFIGQTSMNFGQAHQLKVRDFYYSSDVDGYKVKERKNRRGGDVLFEIFKEYRAHFERYLDWRRQLFPDEKLLFPLVRRGGRTVDRAPKLSRMRVTCRKLGVRFVPPSSIRNTRINWLLRRSGDPDLTAEMAQHFKQTLLTVYETPSLQRTMGETMRFWLQADPAIRTVPVAPGECDGDPVPVPGMPKAAPQPDCIQASGCLWCQHHRDIDSQNYVWALGCFRHLKVIEVGKYRAPQKSPEPHPAEYAISRLSDKLRWFHDSNELRKQWVEEALARVEEGNYHPDWVRLIEDLEGASA